MSIKNFIVLLVLGVTIFNVAADHPDHEDEPSVMFEYDDLADMIEALNDEEDHYSTEEDDYSMQVLPDNDVIYKYIYESHPDDSFQKRGGHRVYRKRKAPKKVRVAEVYPETTSESEQSYSEEPETAPEEVEIELSKEPCEVPEEETIEYTSAEDSYGYVGSLRGKPGVDYPNYKEIPLTSFTCADKEFIPGFYADLETRCQVFHVCYPHRRESFLCPVGTVFNQPILACDYWYNGNCSSAPEHFDVNETEEPAEEVFTEEELDSILDELFPSETEPPFTMEPVSESEEPVKPEVSTKPVAVVVPQPKPIVEVPQVSPPKPIVIEVPEVLPVVPKKPESPAPILPALKFVPVKAKVKMFKKPLAVAKSKAVLGSTLKVLPKKVPVKVLKAKVAAAPLKAIPVAKVVKAAPMAKKAVVGKATFMKAKMAAPVTKPFLFKKAIAANSLLLKKTKLAKAKKVLAAKAAVPVASALTKKHLALSLVKMLKAHKLSVHGYPYARSYYKY